MQFIKPDININFVGRRNIGFLFSLTLIVVSVISLIAKGGPRYGIDFAGGTVVQVRFSAPISPQEIRDALKTVDLAITSVQGFGEEPDLEYLIRGQETSGALESLSTKIQETLQAARPDSKVEVRRVEMVGPKVGKDLREKALLVMFSAILLMSVYISGRFEVKWMLSIVMASCLFVPLFIFQSLGVSIPVLILMALLLTLVLCFYLKLRFAMGAVVSLIHDVVITVGVFSLANKEFDLSVIAALLTISGYSLNDTIVIYDRIRENRRKYHRQNYDQLINKSINETLSRTLLTAGGTLLTVIALLVWGGDIIHDFAFVMLVGILVGTYSSIYVASPILLLWQKAAKTSSARRPGS